MNRLIKVLKVLLVVILVEASMSFSIMLKAEGEEYPLDPDVSFSVKVINSRGEDVTDGTTTAKYGDFVFVKVISNSGEELDINLFDIEINKMLVSYQFERGKYLVKDEGTAIVKVKLLNDPLVRESSISFNTIKGPVIGIHFIWKSDNEIFFATEEIGQNQFKLDFNTFEGITPCATNEISGNLIGWIEFLCEYSSDESASFISDFTTADELEVESSNTEVVKVYKDNYYNSQIFEIVGNGTATITATYKNEVRPKESITFIVENYKSNSASTTNKSETKPIVNENSNINKNDSSTPIVDATNRVDVLDNKLEVTEKVNKINIVYFVVPLTISGVFVALFFILGKNKNIFLITSIIALVLGLAMLGIHVADSNKVNKYNEAINLYLNDNNIEALALLDKIDNFELYEDCKYRAFIEYLLLDNYTEAKTLIENEYTVLNTSIDNYQNAQNSYEKYNALIPLVDDLHSKTNYKYNELEELLIKEIKNHLKVTIGNLSIGESFKYGSYNFKIIDKTGDMAYAISDECLFSTSIDDAWKEKTLAYFNEHEKEFISSNDLILLTRNDYRDYKNMISISDKSWWLDDISSVTRTDNYGNVHKLRYYVVGKDSENDRDTAMINDKQIAGEQSYSYADNDCIWIRPVISFRVGD